MRRFNCLKNLRILLSSQIGCQMVTEFQRLSKGALRKVTELRMVIVANYYVAFANVTLIRSFLLIG